MNSFEYSNPVKVIFNENSLNCIGEETKQYGNNALLVSYTDISFLQSTINIIKSSLHENGVNLTECFIVTANPTIAQAQQGVTLCKEKNIDIIIGLGGGSVMDCAKVIAAGVYFDDNLSQMVAYSHKNSVQIPPKQALATIMIPTLPATGSEMNPTAVITNELTHKKSYVWAPNCLYPKVAIIDPTLTVNLPPYQSACGALDTLAHIVESYFNGNNTNLDLQDRMQEGVIKAVFENLPRVIENPNDIQARGVMMWSASIALNGWLLSGTYTWAPMHQMGHVLSARYHATHGATLSCMMLAWMKFFANREDNNRYEQFAQMIFSQNLRQAVLTFESYIKKYGVQTRISEFGVNKEDIEQLVSDVVEVSFNENGVLGSNPPLRKDDIKQIYLLSL
ncbi:iron-containing alcohol dehydrogenase [Paludicola sp. MB14-C6]|uniref:iron-containing alcohol dehydrogenase n=1 Tax=Paludihabitans sp. MB14-C6 TaxID=3070656 RepID=UPI0027DC6778|nr:iron-containing alcohol dehydrogenase [Paludicola sp. MB14-C6]WMJ22332.1 iron-containing alcohol dehydrogenase [Paludicola sp. MB14-C6]